MGTRPYPAGQIGFISYYGLPLVAKGRVQGVLEILNRTPLQPDADWLEFLNSLGTQAAIAIDNANLFTDLQRTNVELNLAYDATIEGWSRVLERAGIEQRPHPARGRDGHSAGRSGRAEPSRAGAPAPRRAAARHRHLSIPKVGAGQGGAPYRN